MELILTFIGTSVLSGIIGYFIPKIFVFIEYRRKFRRIISTQWKCYYEMDNKKWHVEDNVRISVSPLGYVKIVGRSFWNESYHWVARGKFIDKVYLIGDWMTENPDVRSFGSFMLTVSNDGTKIYGYWGGQSSDFKQGYYCWLMARSDKIKTADEYIEEAKELVRCPKMEINDEKKI